MQVYNDVDVINTHASSDDPYVAALRSMLDDGEQAEAEEVTEEPAEETAEE